GIPYWPDVPRGQPWKEGVLAAIGWTGSTAAAWQRILGSVRTFADLEPELLGRVEELIDFVTELSMWPGMRERANLGVVTLGEGRDDEFRGWPGVPFGMGAAGAP
ncbi:MAG TPA: DUF3097 family protein, partial [Streptosporangiaceae bacterium]